MRYIIQYIQHIKDIFCRRWLRHTRFLFTDTFTNHINQHRHKVERIALQYDVHNHINILSR